MVNINSEVIVERIQKDGVNTIIITDNSGHSYTKLDI